jgi:hypothetical protein
MPLCAVESQPTRDIHKSPHLHHHVRGGILLGIKYLNSAVPVLRGCRDGCSRCRVVICDKQEDATSQLRGVSVLEYRVNGIGCGRVWIWTFPVLFKTKLDFRSSLILLGSQKYPVTSMNSESRLNKWVSGSNADLKGMWAHMRWLAEHSNGAKLEGRADFSEYEIWKGLFVNPRRDTKTVCIGWTELSHLVRMPHLPQFSDGLSGLRHTRHARMG